MAGPKNPEQLRGALGAIRRRLQEVEQPKAPIDIPVDTGLDPSKAPVPVSPRFQAPAIPEMPTAASTSPYKGVEDVANRVLNAPVDRRQFLEGARSGAAALSQIGKFGQLGKILPEAKPPEDLMPKILGAVEEFFQGGHGDDVNTILEGIGQHLDFKRGDYTWSKGDEYDGEPYLDRLREFIQSRVQGVQDEDIKLIEDMITDVSLQDMETHFLVEDGRPKEAFRSMFDPKDVLEEREMLLKAFAPEVRSRIGDDAIDNFIGKVFPDFGERFSNVYENALEYYQDTTQPEKWPQWLKDQMGVED